MRKLYYISPFVMVPISLLLCGYFHNIQFIEMSPCVLGAVLFLLSAVIGNLTPTDKRFDCLMAAIMPISQFVSAFVIGLWDVTEVHGRFDFGAAFQVAVQPVALLMYLVMALTAFLASFRTLRIIRRNTDNQ